MHLYAYVLSKLRISTHKKPKYAITSDLARNKCLHEANYI